MEIKHWQDGEDKKGAFQAYDGDTKTGEMTYVWAGNDRIIVDHTGVEEAYRGKNIGMQLFKSMVSFAREQHIKVVPLCPFVKSTFERFRDDYGDLL